MKLFIAAAFVLKLVSAQYGQPAPAAAPVNFAAPVPAPANFAPAPAAPVSQFDAARFAPAVPAPFGFAPPPFGAAPPSPVNPALLQRLQPRLDAYQQTYSSGNLDGFAALYTDDAIVYPDKAYGHFGKAGARKVAQQDRDSGITAFPIQIIDLREGAPFLMMRGQFQDMKGPAVSAQGKVIQYWTDVNGQLQLKYELYNYDTPANPDQTDTLGDPAVKRRVQARLEEWQKLYESGNMEGLSQLYTETCKVFPHDDFVHNGREGVRKVNQDARDSGLTKNVFRVMEATEGQNLVEAWAYFTDYKGNDIRAEGTNVFVMKDVGGQLQIHYDIYNLEYVAATRNELTKMAEDFYANQWTQLYNAGNIPGMMQLYDPEAVRVANGVPFANGIPAIQQARQSIHDSGFTANIQIYSAHQAGNYLIVNGRGQATKDGVIVGESKFLDLHKIVAPGKTKLLWDTTTNN